MAITIVPQVWNQYVAEQFVTSVNLLASSAVNIDTSANIRAGDNRWRWPKLAPLDSIVTMTQITSSSTLSPTALTDYSELLPVQAWEGGLTLPAYSRITSGVEGLRLLAPQIASLVQRKILTSLAYAATGVFTYPLASTHVYDGSSSTINYAAIGQAALKIGENLQDFTTIVMNSKVFQDARDLNLVTYPTMAITGNQVQTGNIPYIYGMRVWINDTMCPVAAGVYPTYLVGDGMLRVGYQQNLDIEQFRTPLTGGGSDNISFHVYYSVGVAGVSYTSATDNPADTVLDDNSWTQRAQTNNIKMVQLLTQ